MTRIEPALARKISKSQQMKDEQAQANRIYGDDIARVSTVLSTWDDDPEEKLMDWAASLGHGWRESRHEAATIGTHVHEMIEDFFKMMQRGEIVFGDSNSYMLALQRVKIRLQGVMPRHRERVMRAFMAFMDWASRFNSIGIISLEERIICQEMKIGGTCDFKGIIGQGGQLLRVMLDWKTSRMTQMKHKVQLGAYSVLHKIKYPEDEPFDFYGVIRFDKMMGVWEEHYTDHDGILEAEEFFLHMVKGYHMRKKLQMF